MKEYQNAIPHEDIMHRNTLKALLKEHYQYGEGVVVGPLYNKLMNLS